MTREICLPTSFQLYLGGFDPHISLYLEDGGICYSSEGKESICKKFIPTQKQWMCFWDTCDHIDIWSWYPEYILNNWDEGYKWGVHIERGAQCINTCGISMYPGNIVGMPAIEHSSFIETQVKVWSSFTKAVELLLGGLSFMWSDWRPYEFPTHEQTIKNILGEFIKQLPEQARDGFHNDFSISIVDLESAWFQLRVATKEVCVFADTDHTMTPGVLRELWDALETLKNGPVTVYIDFNNEGLDTARIVMSGNKEGITRLTLTDWCDENGQQRLDIEIPTTKLIEKMSTAILRYGEISTLELKDLYPAYFLE